MGETFDTKIDIKYNSNLIIPLPYMSIFQFIIFFYYNGISSADTNTDVSMENE